MRKGMFVKVAIQGMKICNDIFEKLLQDNSLKAVKV